MSGPHRHFLPRPVRASAHGLTAIDEGKYAALQVSLSEMSYATLCSPRTTRKPFTPWVPSRQFHHQWLQDMATQPGRPNHKTQQLQRTDELRQRWKSSLTGRKSCPPTEHRTTRDIASIYSINLAGSFHHFVDIDKTTTELTAKTLRKSCSHSIMGSPPPHIPALGDAPEELELDPEVQASTETPSGETNSLALHPEGKWILLVLPTNVSLDGEMPGFHLFTSSLRGLGFHLANIHSTNSAIIDFMTVSPFVSGTWRSLVAVVLFDPEFPTPPGPLPTAPANITLTAYSHSGGLLIIAGVFQNAFSDPLCFKRFVQDIGLDWDVGLWRQRASVMRCDRNMRDNLARVRARVGAGRLLVNPQTTIYEIQKVLGAFVTNVDNRDVWHMRAFHEEPGKLEALIVMSTVWLGQVGFISDLGLGAASQSIMVAMCQWHSLRGD